jgi:hypothetical protein
MTTAICSDKYFFLTKTAYAATIQAYRSKADGCWATAQKVAKLVLFTLATILAVPLDLISLPFVAVWDLLSVPISVPIVEAKASIHSVKVRAPRILNSEGYPSLEVAKAILPQRPTQRLGMMRKDIDNDATFLAKAIADAHLTLDDNPKGPSKADCIDLLEGHDEFSNENKDTLVPYKDQDGNLDGYPLKPIYRWAATCAVVRQIIQDSFVDYVHVPDFLSLVDENADESWGRLYERFADRSLLIENAAIVIAIHKGTPAEDVPPTIRRAVTDILTIGSKLIQSKEFIAVYGKLYPV